MAGVPRLGFSQWKSKEEFKPSLVSFQPLSPQAVALPGVVVIQGQDPALGLVGPHATGH